MPKQVNTYTFGQALVRKFGLKGRYQPVLDEVIVPVTVVDENIAARQAIGGRIRAAAGAGNQNNIFFENPPNSGVLVTLKKFWAASGAPTTDYLQVSLVKGTAGSSGTMGWADSRLAGKPAARQGGAAIGSIVLGTPQFHLDVDSAVYDVNYILEPNHYLLFVQNAVNTTLVVNWLWEETNLTATVGV